MTRYGFVVLSSTRQRAEQARELAAEVIEGLGMRLHPGKSGIVCLTRGGQGFEFPGFHRKVESWKWRGRFYLQRWPSARALGVLRGKIRAATSRSRTERPVAAVVADLNPVLRGWAGYFRIGNSGRKFNQVNTYVHKRLAIFASRKHGPAGPELDHPLHLRVDQPARGLPPDRERALGDGACQPVNDVGKPGARAAATAPVPDPP
jgi:hypothetical protein